MTIRIGDFIPTQKHINAVMEVIKSGRLTEGPKVKELEKVMADYLGVKNAILVTNGTVALQLVATYLRLNSIEKPLNTIVPALTFPATINAFAVSGYPVGLCDVNPDLQINVDNMSKEHKENTDVLIPVHLMGYPADMDKIMSDAKKYNWIVVEDACEAFGTEYKGKKVGTIGDFGCFSFYVSHNITAGELGMVVTNDDKAAKMMRSMKNHGRTGDNMKFEHSYIGSNYKTTEFCAAIALENMKNVDKILSTRKANCQYFLDNIKNDKLKPYPVPEGFSPLGYPIACETEEYRDEICKKLNENDIETRGMFPCIANQESYKELYSHLNFPVSEKLEKTVFYIGCHHLLSKEDKKKIVKVLSE